MGVAADRERQEKISLVSASFWSHIGCQLD